MISAPDRPKPRSAFRRIERTLVGVVMAVIAFVLERAVLRSIRRGGTKAKPQASEPLVTSRGNEAAAE